MQHIIFHQVDSWFFRESRSMDGSGASMLMSQFPPASATLLGALRTTIGNQYHQQHQTTWADFTQQHDLAKIIGYSQDYGSLKAQGPWLYHQGELYFSVPLNVLRFIQDHKEAYNFFSLPHTAIRSDLGKVIYPMLDYQKGQSALSKGYISASDYVRVLKGEPPQKVYYPESIWCNDGRLGIAIDQAVRKVVDGKLYQTNHIRLLDDWQLYVGLETGHTDCALQNTLVRLGGEARMGSIEIQVQAPSLPNAPAVIGNQLVMYLLTALPDSRTEELNNLPPLPNCHFKVLEKEGNTVWQGIVADIEVEVFSAMVGKLERIGGWDMAAHQSLPVKSYIPAGSCWYIRTATNELAQALVEKLHLNYLTQGNERALGYGQVALGTLVG